jgi:hypothetical protein
MKTSKVYAATISTKYGTNLYLSSSSGGLTMKVHEFVSENWASEFGEMPMPEDPDKAIDEYFDSSQNRGEYLENFDSQEIEK